jgi:hypothetical protein
VSAAKWRVVYGNKRCLYWESDKTHKYVLWAKCSYWMLKHVVQKNVTVLQRININSVHNIRSSLFHWFGITLQILEAAMSTILLHLFWITLVASALSWNLSGFAPLHTPIGQVAVWRNKAYICVPRHNLGTVTATLLEASWPGTINFTHKATQQVQPEFPSPNRSIMIEWANHVVIIAY